MLRISLQDKFEKKKQGILVGKEINAHTIKSHTKLKCHFTFMYYFQSSMSE